MLRWPDNNREGVASRALTREGPTVSPEEVSIQHANVEGLPEPIVRVLEVLVEMARKLLGKQASAPHREHVTLGVRQGTIDGQFSREDIYDDVA